MNRRPCYPLFFKTQFLKLFFWKFDIKKTNKKNNQETIPLEAISPTVNHKRVHHSKIDFYFSGNQAPV